MEKNYKKFIIILLVCWHGSLFAQVTNNFIIPSLANGTSGNGRGPATTVTYHRSCALYTATEFAGNIVNGDTIKRIGWSILTAGSSVSGTMKIYLVNTTDATFLRSTTWATLLTTPTAFTQVYNGPMTIPVSAGVYSLLLTTGFKYTGGNVYLAYEWTPSTAGTVAAIYNCNTNLTGGQWNATSTTALPATLTANSNFRAQVLIGVIPPKIDASVQEVYSLGKLPIPYANPHIVRANIRNKGSDTIFSQKVRLNITGANMFADSVYIDTLAPGVAKTISFNPYSYINLGAGTVVVSLPTDSNNNNNSKTFNQIITTGSYGYADPTLGAAGGVGFTGNSGDFIAKFPYTGSNNINQVGVNFNAGGQPYQIVIYSVVNDTPGVLLWNSSTLTSATGINTVNVSPVVAVSGSFFVGVRQTGTTNVAFGYQAEDPIRSNTFFYKAVTVNNWNDFAVTNSAFRFMVEPRLQVSDDIGVTGVDQPCAAVIAGGAPIAPEFQITNFGVNGQSSYIVRSQITGPVNSTTADTITTFLANGASANIVSNNFFNPTIAGTYTIKVWTQLLSDLERNNDTITYTFVVGNPSNTNASGSGINFNGTNNSLQIKGDGTLNFTGEKLTLEAWVNRTSNVNNTAIISKNIISTAFSQYSLYVNPLGYLVFKVSTSLYSDSVTSTVFLPTGVFTHVAARYDGSTIQILQNGKIVGSKNLIGTIMSSTFPVYIGNSSNNEIFSGIIDEIRIWDTCRTDDQIRTNMHKRLANSSNVNLKAYYHLDEFFGNYLIDASGNCNAATAINAPTLIASNFPLGNPTIIKNTVSTSGSVTFTGTGVNMNIYNQSGDNDIYVIRFTDTVLVTSPIVSPGGISSTFGNYWLMYRYGSGIMDSVEATFSVAGVLSTATNNDFKLFTRANGSNTGWTLSRNFSNGFNLTSQTIIMGIDSTLFNNQFAIGAVNNPLPVKLISFNGTAKNADALLLWSTANETNNKGFEVERSIDGKNFTRIDFVKGAINSNVTQKYSYTDREVFANSKTVYYRLKQVDMDGKFEYTKTITINSEKANNTNIVVYPNPINDVLNIEMESFTNTSAKLVITDLAGKKVKETTLNVNEGINKFTIDNLGELNSGAYIINITADGNILFSNKFIKTK